MRWSWVLLASLVVMPASALADWAPPDGHKMHYPQLPDPTGYDVDVTTTWIYDDWQCKGSGPVNDVHFWLSWKGDQVAPISSVILEVWSDQPVDVNNPFSHPKDKLWTGLFNPTQFNVVFAGTGPQGWISPGPPFEVNKPDHFNFYQVNVPYIDTPFTQQFDTIYWLGVHIIPESTGGQTAFAGWKTSINHFNDDAVFYAGGLWHELRDPMEPAISLDMAFVITPEPAGLVALLGLGVLCLRRRR